MKTLLHSTVLAFSALVAAQEGQAQAMLLASSNGSTQSYALSSIQNVVFHNNTLLVDDGICETHHFSIFFTDYITLDGTIAIGESEDESPLAVYPNPAHDVVRVQLTGVPQADVVIYNALGAKVFAQNKCVMPMSIDIQALPAGLYTISTQTKTIQFVKQ